MGRMERPTAAAGRREGGMGGRVQGSMGTLSDSEASPAALIHPIFLTLMGQYPWVVPDLVHCLLQDLISTLTTTMMIADLRPFRTTGTTGHLADQEVTLILKPCLSEGKEVREKRTKEKDEKERNKETRKCVLQKLEYLYTTVETIVLHGSGRGEAHNPYTPFIFAPALEPSDDLGFPKKSLHREVCLLAAASSRIGFRMDPFNHLIRRFSGDVREAGCFAGLARQPRILSTVVNAYIFKIVVISASVAKVSDCLIDSNVLWRQELLSMVHVLKPLSVNVGGVMPTSALACCSTSNSSNSWIFQCLHQAAGPLKDLVLLLAIQYLQRLPVRLRNVHNVTRFCMI